MSCLASCVYWFHFVLIPSFHSNTKVQDCYSDINIPSKRSIFCWKFLKRLPCLLEDACFFVDYNMVVHENFWLIGREYVQQIAKTQPCTSKTSNLSEINFLRQYQFLKTPVPKMFFIHKSFQERFPSFILRHFQKGFKRLSMILSRCKKVSKKKFLQFTKHSSLPSSTVIVGASQLKNVTGIPYLA